MLENVMIRKPVGTSLFALLEERDFSVDQVTDNVYKVSRFEELPVYIHVENDNLYFMVDLGNMASFASEGLYFKLLDLNTEILPVSVGIDTTDASDPRLVLVESRETQNLDENEVLSVFNTLELATDKIEEVLAEYVK